MKVVNQPPLQASLKYPWRSYRPLRTHDFVEGLPSRRPSPHTVFVCRRCDRRFKFDPDTRATWAVGRDADFSDLEDAVTARWVAEPCLGKRQKSDDEDFKRTKHSAAA
jgi:hypothetical protein